MFVQIFEWRTKNFDEIDALEKQWRAETEGRRTLRRSIVTRDRNDPDRYVVLAFFDSHESAMVNSNLPETTALAEKMAALVESPPVFHDLDVLEDVT